MNLREAADYLGVSERRFHDLRSAGLVPEPIRLGERSLRWHRDELDAHVRSQAPRGGVAEPAHLAARRQVEVA